jgi:hypothetical protein
VSRIEPAYGPSLPELVRPRLRALRAWQRLVLGVALLALVAGGVALGVNRAGQVKTYSQSAADASDRGLEPIPFHLDHARSLKVSRPAGAYVRLERQVNGTLQAQLTVSELQLGRQSGLVSGFLPIVATRYEREAARAYEGFRLQFEGRARVNLVEGYQFAFTARLARPGHAVRQLFGRVVLLPEPLDPSDPAKAYPPGRNATSGLVITMLATTLDKVPSATRVGDEGLLQRPYRSFRFGS